MIEILVVCIMILTFGICWCIVKIERIRWRLDKHEDFIASLTMSLKREEKSG